MNILPLSPRIILTKEAPRCFLMVVTTMLILATTNPAKGQKAIELGLNSPITFGFIGGDTTFSFEYDKPRQLTRMVITLVDANRQPFNIDHPTTDTNTDRPSHLVNPHLSYFEVRQLTLDELVTGLDPSKRGKPVFEFADLRDRSTRWSQLPNYAEHRDHIVTLVRYSTIKNNLFGETLRFLAPTLDKTLGQELEEISITGRHDTLELDYYTQKMFDRWHTTATFNGIIGLGQHLSQATKLSSYPTRRGQPNSCLSHNRMYLYHHASFNVTRIRAH